MAEGAAGGRISLDTPDGSWARLARTLEDYDIAFFIGAGLSCPNNFPSWGKLTASLSNEPVTRVDAYLSSGVSLATQLQIARDRAISPGEWTRQVRSALYDGFLEQVREFPQKYGRPVALTDFGSEDKDARARVRAFFQATNPLLLQLVESCSVEEGRGRVMNDRIGAILTTNLDGLLQMCDRACHGSPRMLRTVERVTQEAEAEKISLYHLHGYLQVTERPARDEAADALILTEGEYLERNDDPYSWASTILHWSLREFPLIFVGCSMTDELVRRALRRLVVERVAHLKKTRGADRVKEDRWRRQYALMKYDPDWQE